MEREKHNIRPMKTAKYILQCMVILVTILVAAGCSITSGDIGLSDISVSDDMNVTATVTISNIGLDNFKKDGANTLRTVDIYYAYTPEKREALAADTSCVGVGPRESTINLPTTEYDGVYRYNVPEEDVAAFKSGTENSWSQELSFTIPEAGKGRDIDFVVLLNGHDNDGTNSRDGWASSSIIPYEVPRISVKVDVGEGHGDLFTDAKLADMIEKMGLESATIEGDVVTLTGVNGSLTKADFMMAVLRYLVQDFDIQSVVDDEEIFMNEVAPKSLDEYETYNDMQADQESEAYATPVEDNFKCYLLWKKPYKTVEIDNGNPTCGKEARRTMPTAPNGIVMDWESSSWKDENDESVETFVGDKEYTLKGVLYFQPYGALWKYYLPDTVDLTVKDSTDLDYSVVKGTRIIFSFKATVDHDWDEGTVTKEPTTTAEGEKTFKCKNYDTCKGEKTEKIAKLKPATEPVVVAKGIVKGKKAVKISWNKVSGADRYVIYLAKCNYKGKKYTCKKVKTVNAKTLKWSKGKLAKNTAYKFYVVAQNKSGKTIAKSKVGHFFTGNVRGKYTNPKSLTLSKSALTLKKGKSDTIKGSVTKVKKGKKLATGHAAKLRYISNNPSVATVNAKGKVTAKAKGTAVIYAQTINGIWKTCKVTVN